MQPDRLTISPDSVRMVELGHPWIIADSHTKKWPKGSVGDLVELQDPQGKFLATALLDPAERIVARILAREKIKFGLQWFETRLERAINLRKNHCDLEGTDAFRLVNGEGDYLPGITVDSYGGYLMVQLYGNAWRPHLPMVTKALQEMLSPQGIYEKSRPQKTRELEAKSESKDYGRLLWGKAADPRLKVRENGLTFLVSLGKGLDTGLYPDQRKNRRLLLAQGAGKQVLNLFSYTGAFSVAAAVAGATRVTSVDVSPAYTEWAKANFAANRINPARHEFIVGDCLATLAELRRQGRGYDIIIMDPPSFSTTAKNSFTTRRGTSDLVAAVLPMLRNGGLLLCSSNHQKIDMADYLKELRRGALAARCGLQVLATSGQPEDFPYPVTFPEGRYLKFVVCTKCGDNE